MVKEKALGFNSPGALTFGVINMKKDISNQQFGRLTAKEIVGKNKKGYLWRCECECGGEKIVPAAYLANGHTRSCGCLNAERKAKLDITGQRWGRLVAIKQVGYTTVEKTGKKQALWLWQCDCGNTKEIPATQVKNGGTRSCGCKALEHITSLKRQDITGQQFGKLTAIQPTEDRDNNGGIIWELKCECGNLAYKTVNVLKTGRVLSCGCKYRESRQEVVKHRLDIVDGTSISSIVKSKKPRSNNTSGFTGVSFDSRAEKWEAYINFKKKRYRLGSFKDLESAATARRNAEAKLHDPIVLQYWDNLTDARKSDFIAYLNEEQKTPLQTV